MSHLSKIRHWRRNLTIVMLFGLLTTFFYSAGITISHAAVAIPDARIRAQSWVDAGVGYSQSTYYTNKYGSYRMDCSGYVSMIWSLDSSYSTSTLPQVSYEITKEELASGDIMLKSGHAVMFDSWVDSDRTYYWAYEEISQGAVHRKIPYPYFSSSGTYVPRRSNTARISTSNRTPSSVTVTSPEAVAGEDDTSAVAVAGEDDTSPVAVATSSEDLDASTQTAAQVSPATGMTDSTSQTGPPADVTPQTVQPADATPQTVQPADVPPKTVQPADVTPPTMTSVHPLAQSADVDISALITATFSEGLAASTVTEGHISLTTGGTAVKAAIAYDAKDNKVTITPSEPLTHSTSYTVTMSGVADVAGNLLADPIEWTFTTITDGQTDEVLAEESFGMSHAGPVDVEPTTAKPVTAPDRASAAEIGAEPEAIRMQPVTTTRRPAAKTIRVPATSGQIAGDGPAAAAPSMPTSSTGTTNPDPDPPAMTSSKSALLSPRFVMAWPIYTGVGAAVLLGAMTLVFLRRRSHS